MLNFVRVQTPQPKLEKSHSTLWTFIRAMLLYKEKKSIIISLKAKKIK